MATHHLQQEPAQDNTRARLLAAAKHLFCLIGYENTTPEAISREAQTTEQSLPDNFAGKIGLLQAIFEEGWSALVARLTRLQEVATPQRKLKNIARAILQHMGQDSELRDLILLDGRRIVAREMVMITPSYTDLVALVDSLLIEAMPQVSAHQLQMLRSSFMGTIEGVVRDLALQERCGYPSTFSMQQAEHFVPELVERLFQSQGAAAEQRTRGACTA